MQQACAVDVGCIEYVMFVAADRGTGRQQVMRRAAGLIAGQGNPRQGAGRMDNLGRRGVKGQGELMD